MKPFSPHSMPHVKTKGILIGEQGSLTQDEMKQSSSCPKWSINSASCQSPVILPIRSQSNNPKAIWVQRRRRRRRRREDATNRRWWGPPSPITSCAVPPLGLHLSEQGTVAGLPRYFWVPYDRVYVSCRTLKHDIFVWFLMWLCKLADLNNSPQYFQGHRSRICGYL